MDNEGNERQSVEQNDLRLKREGIILLENVTTFPGGNKTYISDNYVIVINQKGYLSVLYNNEEITFKANDVSVVYPGTSILARKLSKDYRATVIVVLASLLDEPLLEIINLNRYRYVPQPNMMLDKHEHSVLMKIVDLMRETIAVDIPEKRSILALQLRSFLYFLNYYRQIKLNENIVTNRLSIKFHTELTKHYREHRDVDFYARQVCISPKHFSAVIKKETGRNAAHIIQSYVVGQAKLLLDSRPDLAIQDIAFMMGFAEQSAFSRYFKRETGISPKHYQEKKHSGKRKNR